MHKRTLVWKLFPVYFVITLASVAVVGLLALGAMREFYYAQTEEDLAARARLVREQLLAEHLALEPRARLNAVVREIARSAGVRLTVILPSGEVAADSESDPAAMANHADRPEFRQAMRASIGRSRRISPTLHTMMIYVAVPMKADDKLAAVLRVAENASAVDARPSATYHRVGAAALLVAILAGIVSLIAARRISRPLRQLKDVANQLATGDLASRAQSPDTLELAGLADALNRMASRLNDQIRRAERQSREQGAILSSMGEGVIAVGDDDRVLILNPAAERLLGVAAESVRGKTVQEALRYPALQRFIEDMRAGEATGEEEPVLHAPGNRLARMTCTALRDEDGKRIGLLVVLSDITQAHKLEEMRSDFAANVSHELKTPITSIKGFVETLREGALGDSAKAREFLEIIARQSDRLEAIIRDLLALSEIEQKEDTAGIPMQRQAVRPVIEAAIVNLRARASEYDVTIDLDCPGDISATMNLPLMEQAVTNLLDNAVKYSPRGGQVTVRAEMSNEEVTIHVSDAGPGIEPEHIPRLFERFYRVDKARSRKLGGTGLGLAIVKHIVQAHHGRTEVESTPGKGSTFTIRLP